MSDDKPKMNPDVKAKWLEALRSEEYVQGQGALHTQDGDDHKFCCLGVLCDIAAKEGVAVSVIGQDGGEYTYDGAQDIPPRSVADWAGLYDPNPRLPYETTVGPGSAPVSELNDCDAPSQERALDFFEIADLIEENL